MKLKNVKRLKFVVDVIVVINIIAAILSFFVMYGAVGTMDYNAEMHIHEDETYLTVMMFAGIVSLVLTTLAARCFKWFSDFLEECIEVRTARIRQRRIQMRINQNRDSLGQRAIR